MCQSSSANDEIIYEGARSSHKRGGDQCGWCQWFEMRLSIPNKCYNINLK